MSDALKPYPAYKDSGAPWLGPVPAHWTSLRAKYLYRESNERSQTGTEQLCSVSHKTGVTPRKSNVTMFMAETTLGYKICRPDDLAINTLWAWMAALGVARQVGVVSPAYGVYRPLPKSDLVPAFADYLLRTPPYMQQYMALSTGVNASRLRLYPDRFLSIPILLPPRDEQKAIACYLDANAAVVRRFIQNRRRLIEVLNEQKQAIINRAVTRGLDARVPLKPSGVAWLGDIPARWQHLKLKRIARINPSRAEVFHLRESAEPVVFLPMERVSAQGEVDSAQRRPIHEVWQGFTYFRRGDVVVAKITPCFENGKGACLRDLPTEIGFGTTEFIVLRPCRDISAEFLYQLTQLGQFRLLGVESMTGAAGQQRVAQDFVANFDVPLPPANEQGEIVEFLRSTTAQFRAATDRAQREIDLIREFRTRLIADVVTGKVDVRDAVRHLPEEEAQAAEVVDAGDEPENETTEPDMTEETFADETA